MARYKVLRNFMGNGVMRNPGDVVDGDDFRNLRALEDQRYLRLYDGDDVTANPAGAMVTGGGPTPDVRLVQEQQGRENRAQGTGDEGGGLAALPETMEKKLSDDPDADADDATESMKKLSGSLPDEMPGVSALRSAGITSYGKLRKYKSNHESLTEIPNIGTATEAKINDFMVEKMAEIRAAEKGGEGVSGGADGEEVGDKGTADGGMTASGELTPTSDEDKKTEQ